MAATNRRQLLTGAAAYAAGAAIVAGGAALAGEAKGATVGPREWEKAMRAYKRECARSKLDDSNEQADAEWEASNRLLQMPAPDAEALAWKIEYFFSPDREGYIESFAHSYVKQTLVDAVRLAGGIPAGALA